MDYCIWIYNKAGQYYITSCCNQEIDEHDYEYYYKDRKIGFSVDK